MSTLVLNKLPGGSFAEVGLGRKLPAGDRCVAWFELGVSDRLSVRNHAAVGSRGLLINSPVVAAAGISAGALVTALSNIDFTSGDYTIIAFFKPGQSGADLSAAFYAGGATQGQFINQSAPVRYSNAIQQRVFTGAAYDVVSQCGTYDSTTPAADGVNNSLSRLLAAGPTQTLCVISEFVAATRVHTVTLRNGAAFATPSTATNTAAVNHVRDSRNTEPFEMVLMPTSNAVGYSFMVFNGVLSAAEKNAVYALEQARLTALGVPNL